MREWLLLLFLSVLWSGSFFFARLAVGHLPPLTMVTPPVALAGFSTALAYILYFRILASAGATSILLVTFLVPVSAILLGIGFLGESLQLKHLAGMALIGLGLAAIDGRPWHHLRNGKPTMVGS